jgi:hypothetical protein
MLEPPTALFGTSVVAKVLRGAIPLVTKEKRTTGRKLLEAA